eukprot:12924928-Prorocentrum_lima.AAC.1
MQVVEPARKEHGDWLELPPEQQAAVDSSYCFGNEVPTPQHGNIIENHLRVDVMESIPKHIQLQRRNYGMFGTIGILARAM